jgi:hypothetical protein
LILLSPPGPYNCPPMFIPPHRLPSPKSVRSAAPNDQISRHGLGPLTFSGARGCRPGSPSARVGSVPHSISQPQGETPRSCLACRPAPVRREAHTAAPDRCCGVTVPACMDAHEGHNASPAPAPARRSPPASLRRPRRARPAVSHPGDEGPALTSWWRRTSSTTRGESMQRQRGVALTPTPAAMSTAVAATATTSSGPVLIRRPRAAPVERQRRCILRRQ